MKYANAVSAMNSTSHADRSTPTGVGSASTAGTHTAAALEDSSWFASSLDLASGLLVRELTETFPTESFQQTLAQAHAASVEQRSPSH